MNDATINEFANTYIKIYSLLDVNKKFTNN